MEKKPKNKKLNLEKKSTDKGLKNLHLEKELKELNIALGVQEGTEDSTFYECLESSSLENSLLKKNITGDSLLFPWKYKKHYNDKAVVCKKEEEKELFLFSGLIHSRPNNSGILDVKDKATFALSLSKNCFIKG